MREINEWEKVKLTTNPKKCVNKGIQWWVKCEGKKSGNIHKVWRNKMKDNQPISV